MLRKKQSLETMYNPLLKIWQQERGQSYEIVRKQLVNKRLVAAETYAWAVPNEESLDEIAKYSPILEIGAGLGYWAKMLEDKGVHIVATDPNPPDPCGILNEGWIRIHPGGAEWFLKEESKTLFMSWVPEQAAQGVVEAYKGDIILWVGEPIDFPNFNEIKMVEIPQWSGYDDALYVFKRRTHGKA